MSQTLGSDSEVTTTSGQTDAQENPASTDSGETNENSEAHGDDGESEGKTEESDGDESKDSDGSDDEQDESGDESQKGEKKTGITKRISKLVKQKQALKEELDYYKSQVIRAGKNQADEDAQGKGASVKDVSPNPDEFDSYEEYQSALIQYNVQKALNPALDEIKKTIARPKTEAEAQKVQKTFENKIKAFVKEHSDYAEAVQSLDGITVDRTVEIAIVQSEHGPALLYELGKNPDLAEEIAELPPHLQMKEIGKLEARLEARIEARKKNSSKTTNAPAPPNPVGTKSDGKKSIFDKGLSFTEYERIRREQQKTKR